MSLNDPLASSLSKIHNAEKVGKSDCSLRISSKLIKKVLTILNEEGYLGSFEEKKDSKGEWLIVNLIGKVNNCGAIKPRHALDLESYEKFEKRYLPARNFGVLLVSTSQGLITHIQAKEKKIGGKLIAYCY